jgi:hypothetical protein
VAAVTDGDRERRTLRGLKAGVCLMWLGANQHADTCDESGRRFRWSFTAAGCSEFMPKAARRR